jgi:DNA-binding GntR family transcriptional regulator
VKKSGTTHASPAVTSQSLLTTIDKAAENPRKLPLYKEIAETLYKRITEGQYPLGTRLPTEAELCLTFGASHHTLRDALKILIEKGMIFRRAGSGSSVIALKEATVFAHVVLDLSQLVGYPQSAKRVNLSTEFISASADEARLLQCPPGSPWFRISAIRHSGANPEPVCWTYFYLLPRHAQVVKNKDHFEVPVYEQIERLGGEKVARVKIDNTVGPVPAEITKALKVLPQTPALITVRRYLDAADQHLQITVSFHPQGRFVSSWDFRRETRS